MDITDDDRPLMIIAFGMVGASGFIVGFVTAMLLLKGVIG